MCDRVDRMTEPSEPSEATEDELRRELDDLEDRIDAVSLRLSLDYGSETARDGYRLWIADLRRKRDELRTRLGLADEGST